MVESVAPTYYASHAQTLTALERARLLDFLGFGNPRAPYVFLGMEEGLSETDDDPLLAQLRARARLETIADLRDSRLHPEKYLSGEHPPIQATWNVLIRILLALEGKREPTTDDVREYQRDTLGSTYGDSLLLELMPLPARSLHSWSPYDRFFPSFPNRATYLAHILPQRIRTIRERLAYGPKLVVAYGTGYQSEYARIFPFVARWERRGEFSYGRSGKTAVLLMPHPTARQMNGNRETLCDLAVELCETYRLAS